MRSVKGYVLAAIGATAVGTLVLSGQNHSDISEQQAQAMAALVTPPSATSFDLALSDDSNVDCVAALDDFLTPLMIRFQQGATTISPENGNLLAHIGYEILDCPDSLVLVSGHADGNKDDNSNLEISWERADATLGQLVALGVDPAALEAVGFGARMPLSQGSNEDAAANGRVDFRVLRRRAGE